MTIRPLYISLWVACILGSMAIIPYILFLNTSHLDISVFQLLGYSVAQSALLYGVLLWVCSYYIPKTDIDSFRWSGLYPVILYGVSAGLLVGALLFGLEQYVFKTSPLSSMHPPKWAGLLASFFGGVNEEVLLRLFFFTIVYYYLGKILSPKQALFWVTNCLIALLFGLGHLPVALKIVEPSTFEVVRILILNGIAGLVFGWLYWSQGIWTAMVAHFVTDSVIHVFLI